MTRRSFRTFPPLLRLPKPTGNLDTTVTREPDDPQPTADTWVMRETMQGTPDGPLKSKLVAVKVADMEDGHLLRWIGYFRRKLKTSGDFASYTNAMLDIFLRANMVTAPAIYDEAIKRGLMNQSGESSALDALGVLMRTAPPAPRHKKAATQAATDETRRLTVPEPGARLITLGDDEP